MRFTAKDVFPLYNSPGYLLNLATREINAHLARAFKVKGYKVTPQQWGLLSKLWEKEGLHQNELAAHAAKDRHNVARILVLMEKNGLIQRRPDQQDRRVHRVYLTETGRSLQPGLTSTVLEVLDQAFQGVNTGEVRRFNEICRRVIANISHSRQAEKGDGSK